MDRLGATQKRLIESETKRARVVANALGSENSKAITKIFEGEDDEFVKSTATALLYETDRPFCLADVTDGKLRWYIGGSKLDKEEGKSLLRDLLPIVDGRGGGRPPLWQGAGTGGHTVADFMAAFCERIARGQY